MKVKERFNQHFKELNENDHYIWQYISENSGVCAEQSINRTAEQCHVSHTTLLRFAKKLGYKGYSELKVDLRRENGRAPALNGYMDRIIGTYSESVERFRQQNCEEIFKLFERADNLYVYPTGHVQLSAAQELMRVFLQAGLLFNDVKGRHEIPNLLKILTPRDCVVLISFSGNTPEVVELCKRLRIFGVPTVSMTCMHENELARHSTHNLYVSSAQVFSDKTGVAYDSLTGFFILIEMLFAKYLDYREQRGHKGGARD